MRGHLESREAALQPHGASPMKTLIVFLASIIAIKSDGDAAAVMLRER